MTKQEWKAKYSALRALYNAAIRMSKYEKTVERKQAINFVSELMRTEGVWDAFIGNMEHKTYPISENRWAISHNCRGY